ncbi:MAG: RluA family pseudouridine synthase [Roseburia sp.]|nr:RluA family pseudouridine synthase [Roseburia sp.]
MKCVEILYEDNDIIVCNKPAGVATQTKQIGQKDMESILRTYRMQKGEPSYIGVVHRLDQPVSGVMVFAKTKEAAADLSKQVSTKAADKYYYAVTDGVPEKLKGTLEDYLLRDGKTNLSKVVTGKEAGAKRAELAYEVIAKNETQALVRVKLATGRHHQIRVQMANAGWPLVGDRKYNFKENMKPGGQPMCLCSYKLGFTHPVTKKKLEFEIENPFSIL